MTFKLVDFTIISRRAVPNPWDFVAFTMIVGIFIAVAQGARGMTAPLPPDAASVTLDYFSLPYYALRTTLRMFAALAASFLFTFIYATLAAKSRRAEMVLIPILDVLQSVPVLGFLSFTATFFPGAVSRQHTRRGMRGNLRHLYEPGVEHGLLVLSVVTNRPSRSGRGGAWLPA